MIDRILYGRFYKGDSMSRMTKEEVKQRVCKAIVDAQPCFTRISRIYYG